MTIWGRISICLVGTGLMWTHAACADVFINEFHYDNAGGDVGEFFEIAGPAGLDLTGWAVEGYNGSSSQLNVYNNAMKLKER